MSNHHSPVLLKKSPEAKITALMIIALIVSFSFVILFSSSVNASTIFSDNFASGNFSAWTSHTSNIATMTVQSSTVFTGNYAAEITDFGISGSGYGFCSETISGVTTLCLETSFYMTTDMILSSKMADFVYALGGTYNYHLDLYRNPGGTYAWSIVADGLGTYTGAASIMPLNTWNWIELDITEASVHGNLTMYFNSGTPFITETGLNLGSTPITTARIEAYGLYDGTVYFGQATFADTYVGAPIPTPSSTPTPTPTPTATPTPNLVTNQAQMYISAAQFLANNPTSELAFLKGKGISELYFDLGGWYSDGTAFFSDTVANMEAMCVDVHNAGMMVYAGCYSGVDNPVAPDVSSSTDRAHMNSTVTTLLSYGFDGFMNDMEDVYYTYPAADVATAWNGMSATAIAAGKIGAVYMGLDADAGSTSFAYQCQLLSYLTVQSFINCRFCPIDYTSVTMYNAMISNLPVGIPWMPQIRCAAANSFNDGSPPVLETPQSSITFYNARFNGVIPSNYRGAAIWEFPDTTSAEWNTLTSWSVWEAASPIPTPTPTPVPTPPTPTPAPTPTPTSTPIWSNTVGVHVLFFRPDTYTTLGVTGYALDTSYLNNYQTGSFYEGYSGTGTVTYGFRIYLYSSISKSTELTNGSPEALIIENGNYTGVASSTFNMPQTSVILGYQALQINLEEQYAGGQWITLAIFVSPVLVTDGIAASTWTFNLYIIDNQTGGSTDATALWGNKDYPSSISGAAFVAPTTSEIGLWDLQRGDLIGLILLQYLAVLGSAFYVIILFGMSAVLWFRYKNTGVILYFIVTLISGGLMFALLPVWAAPVAAAFILLIITFVFYRLVR